MFTNIGNKIKKLAVILCILGTIPSVIGGLFLLSSPKTGAIGILVAIGGCIFSWIGSFALYGYGELIDCAQQIRTMLGHTPSFQANNPSQPVTICQKCGFVSKPPSEFCTNCGSKLNVLHTETRTSAPMPSLEDRLSALKKWKEQGLISAEEYQRKVNELS